MSPICSSSVCQKCIVHNVVNRYLSWMCILFSRPSGTRSGCLICWPYGPCPAVKKHIKQKIYSSPWNRGVCYIFILWYSYYKQSLFNALIYYCFRINSMTQKKRQSMQRGMLVCFTYLFLSSKWTFISVCLLSLSLTQLILIRQCWTINLLCSILLHLFCKLISWCLFMCF